MKVYYSTQGDKGSANFGLVLADLLGISIVRGTAVTKAETTKLKVVICEKWSSLHAIIPGDGRTGCWLRKGWVSGDTGPAD